MPDTTNAARAICRSRVLPVSFFISFPLSRRICKTHSILICSGVRHPGSNNAGEHAKMIKALGREVATFSGLKG